MAEPVYKRVLLKLSGEALMGDDQFGINRASIEHMVKDVIEATKLGVEMAIVIGGGNIFRGVAPGAKGMDRATADYMGMLATVINSLALSDSLRQAGITTRVMSAIGIEQVVESYVRPKVKSLSLRLVQVIRSLRPILLQPCAVLKSVQNSF